MVFRVSVRDLLYTSGSLCHPAVVWNTSPPIPPQPHQQPSSSCGSQAFLKEEELGESISNPNSSSAHLLGQHSPNHQAGGAARPLPWCPVRSGVRACQVICSQNSPAPRLSGGQLLLTHPLHL